MGLYDELINLPSRITPDGSLAAIVTKTFKERFKVDQRPPHYYYLTDLCNPTGTYWSHKKKDIERRPEIANKLALGNRLQRIAFSWMRKIPDYIGEETHLDGDYMGVKGVVGKYDMRWGSSIIEFKTKPEQVLNVEEIFTKYPQDLEQICFYAAIHPEEMATHYLIFQLDHPPYSFTVFRVEINKIGPIRHIMRQRINQLDKAREMSDPSKLGRCRYYENGCDFDISGVCGCSSAKDLPLSQLINSIEVTKDKKKGEELKKARKELRKSASDIFRPWELLKPRPWFLNNIHGITETYETETIKMAYQDSLQKAVTRSSTLKLSGIELDAVKNNILDLPIIRTWRWAAIRDTRLKGDSRRIVPILLRVSTNNYIHRRMPTAYNAVITLACIVSKSNIGAVVVIYPNKNEHIRAFTVSFEPKIIGKGEKLLDEAISKITKAADTKSLGELDLCPNWAKPEYCKTKSCPNNCEKLADETPSIEISKSK